MFAIIVYYDRIAMYRIAVIIKCIVLYLTVEIVRLKSGHVVVQRLKSKSR